MVLTRLQEEAVKICVERYKHNERYTVVAGYAGTGKSTIIPYIISALNLDPEKDIVYTSFTGKATRVLAEKGCNPVNTLHHLLYTFSPNPQGGFFRQRNQTIPYKVVVVDEVSMPNKELINELFSHKECYVLCFGDPGQLPPINKDDDNGLLKSPHIFLDEIHRQAQDSEIIQVSMAIREGKPLKPFKGKEVQIYRKNELNQGMLLWADQVLCATNNTRNLLNTTIRQLLKLPQNLTENDKIICCRNYRDIVSKNEDILVNGTIGYINKLLTQDKQTPAVKGSTKIPFQIYRCSIKTENDDIFYGLKLDKQFFDTGKKLDFLNDWKLIYKINNFYKTPFAYKMHLENPLPIEFDYGYAITTWKAQGSQWNNVLLIEEGHPFDRKDHMAYLYTGVTRAIDKCVIILQN